MSLNLSPGDTILVPRKGTMATEEVLAGARPNSNFEDDEISTLSDHSISLPYRHPLQTRSAHYQGSYPIRSKSKLQAYLNMKKHESTELGKVHASNVVRQVVAEESRPFQPRLEVGNNTALTEQAKRKYVKHDYDNDDDVKSLPSRSSIDGDDSADPFQVDDKLNQLLETRSSENIKKLSNGKPSLKDQNESNASNTNETSKKMDENRLRRLKKRNAYRQMMKQRRQQANKNTVAHSGNVKQQNTMGTLRNTRVFQTRPNLQLKEALTLSCKYDSDKEVEKSQPKCVTEPPSQDNALRILERLDTFRRQSLANQERISKEKLLSSPQSHTSVDTQTTATMTTTTTTSSTTLNARDKVSHASFLKEWMNKVEKEYGVRPEKSSEVNEWNSQTLRCEKEVLHRVMNRTKAKVCVKPFPGIQVAMKTGSKIEPNGIQDPPCLRRVSSPGLNEEKSDFKRDIKQRDNVECIQQHLDLNNKSENCDVSRPEGEIVEELSTSDLDANSDVFDSWKLQDAEIFSNKSQSRLEQFFSDKEPCQTTSFSSLADSTSSSDLSTSSSEDLSVDYETHFEKGRNDPKILESRLNPRVFNTFSENGNENIEIEYRSKHMADETSDEIEDPECTTFQLTRTIPKSFTTSKRSPQDRSFIIGSRDEKQHKKALQRIQMIARKVWKPSITQFEGHSRMDTGIDHCDDDEFLLGNCCTIHGDRYAFDSLL